MLKRLRRWLQKRSGTVETPLDGETPIWIGSLIFHLILLVIVANVFVRVTQTREVELSADAPVDVIDPVVLPPELEFDSEPAEEVGALGDAGANLVTAAAPVLDAVFEDTVSVDMPMHDASEIFSDDDPIMATAETISALPVQGTVGESFRAATGAIDRLTQEILHSLEERETLVVWMFDQSASLQEQRFEIVARFDKVYSELGLLQAAGHKAFDSDQAAPLLTQVYAFGQQHQPLLKEPTADLEEIRDAVRRIERDDSGIENVMAAVTDAANRYRSLRRVRASSSQPQRNVMLVLVTDEAGDDTDQLDATIATCQKYQIPVHVLGVPAPFGRAETFVKWVDPDPQYDQTPQWAVVSQGPETMLPERLRLDFTGRMDDLEAIDSGFGPYHLTRLCYETGGIYFAIHPNRDERRPVERYETRKYSAFLRYFFSPDVMKRYRPDYISTRAYMKQVQSSNLRRALVESAAYTTTGTLESPQLRFPKFDEGRFVREVSQAQQQAAIIEPKINRLYEMISEGESERINEISLRWQAGFDLAMGQVIATKVRTEAYNAMLALIKTKLDFDPPKDADTPRNNTWLLRPSRSTETGSYDQKLIEKAEEYLRRVVRDHPDTPWAMIAKRELATPMGWQWRQTYMVPPEERDRDPGTPRPRNAERPPQKPMRAPPKL